MRSERIVRSVAAALILILGLSYAIWSFPSRPKVGARLLDFSEFYAAGQMVREGYGAHLYDLKTQAEFQLRVAPVHAFYLRPPFEALAFVPLTFLSYRSAYTAWLIASFAMLTWACWLIFRNTGARYALLKYTRGIPVDFGLLLVLFLTFEPTMDCLLIGQDSVVMLLVYTLVFCSLKRNREMQAGALLGCGLFKFHLVLPFVVISLFRRRNRFLLGFAVAAAILLVVSMAVSGPAVVLNYPRMFFDSGMRQLMGFQPEYAANIRGLVYLAVGAGPPAALQISVVAALSLLVLWIAARQWNDTQFDLSFSAAIIATLLTGFHAFVYDLSLLLLSVAALIGALATRSELLRQHWLNAALIMLFVPPIHHFLIVYHAYALMGLALIVLFAVATRAAPRSVIPAGLQVKRSG